MLKYHAMKKIFTPLLFVGFVFMFTGCSQTDKATKTTTETFKVMQPVITDTQFTREYIAEIQSLQNVEIRTHVKGFIEKIHVDEGKPVQKGQVLFTLSSREFRENLLKANANYKSLIAELKVAEVELKNTKTLSQKNIVSSSELDMAIARKEAIEAKLEEAKSAISIAQLNLSFTQVKAPFTGVINRIPFKTGSLVLEGDLLTTISNNTEVFAYFNVSEKEFIDLVRKNDKGAMEDVQLLMANNEYFQYKGKIETVENEIDPETGNIAFRARFRNPNHILKHGSSGKILMQESLKQAMIIPQKATFEIQDKTFVYVVDNNNVVRSKQVKPRLRMPHLYVIASGVSANDRFIYEGIQHVKDGDKITPQIISLKDVQFD